ncbi:hypothetical protein FHU37_000507 [Allostreptomyces psammosilenae]|uniref:DUF5753 domain-containing protein n=1 Tax=Allostreptomyces psammosilenae TaxID=1892865 RepID=A0A852ZRS6_9ACTN|nr:hypothetical protein [Allostreptomyces psammosilenae]
MTLLDIYGVAEEDPKRDLILRLSRERSMRGWWQSYEGSLNPGYAEFIALESAAAEVQTFQPLVVPGLFQTSAYARAVIGATAVDDSPETVEPLVQVRMGRQAALVQPHGPVVTTVVHEAALRANTVPPGVMRSQLDRLMEIAELPNATFQVLPMAAPAHPGLTGAFQLLRFEAGPGMDVALVELLTTSIYVDAVPEVERYALAFQRIREMALTAEATQDLLHRVKKEIAP